MGAQEQTDDRAEIPQEIVNLAADMSRKDLERFWFFPNHSLCGRSPECAWPDGLESQQLIRDLIAARVNSQK